jgi:hypothetical protein
MRAINGYLENGRFMPSELITFPKRVQAVLVFEDVSIEQEKSRSAWLREFHHLRAAAADEDMPDFPRLHFGREVVDLSDEA